MPSVTTSLSVLSSRTSLSVRVAALRRPKRPSLAYMPRKSTSASLMRIRNFTTRRLQRKARRSQDLFRTRMEICVNSSRQ
ncbi:hypothetical protein SEA_FORZA_85 [Gordonia phage Forza]|uniref:Uncharacterized protein n=1 Tax=Gordonia phage Forza TaxID=2571247 RepID=A0A650EZH2_9CAUD|nr:hypothetical protein PP303_gp085 [Gordonia phage Forza]QGT55078.1 hypothetical protein SEA_FORZA_85 [Gordonia phage Forza]